MLKLRLLKDRYNDYSQVLDSASIPEIESLDELFIVAQVAGKLLKPYAESLRNPNLVSVLLDASIKNWTVNDIESLQYSLSEEGFALLITKEEGEDLEMTPAQVKYIMVDSSTKFLTAIPFGYTRIVDRKEAVESIKVIDVIASFLSEFTYFDPNKFITNPLNNFLEQLHESRKLLGTLNQFAMNKLSAALMKLNKRLYVISQS